ncbi:DUF6812 domain-containing protein [Oceanidesulfovibrio indonesiensis]|nr:hypothetical protein [Oceanidesulfovibrio indonesiensis]
MDQDSSSRIIVALRDGTVVKGSVNLRVYSPMGRLSDGLNKAEDFVVLTHIEFLQAPDRYPEAAAQTDVLLVNRMQIVWAAPLD